MNNYEFVQSIGRGAHGSVYQFKRKSDGKIVVVKQIYIESITDEEYKHTMTEVKILSILHHPNIIEYYESFLHNYSVNIVMEYAPGGNLYDYLRSRGENNYLQEEHVLHLFCQLVLGLKNIHEHNILHRDLKSHNVLLDERRRVIKIGDFGISKILKSKSKAYSVVGTPCYLSPELCQEKSYNQKSDIWALGCLLYEMLMLKRPFEAETIPALIMKIMKGRVESIAPQYSKDVQVLVNLLLHKDENQRPNIYQVVGQPIVFSPLFKLLVNLGKVNLPVRNLKSSDSCEDCIAVETSETACNSLCSLKTPSSVKR